MAQPEIKIPTRQRIANFLRRKFGGQKPRENIADRKPAVTLRMHLNRLEREYKIQKRRRSRRKNTTQ